jgi:hypothetical protein
MVALRDRSYRLKQAQPVEPSVSLTTPGRTIAIGDAVQLVCPIPCDELGVLTQGIVVHAYPGDQVYEVRFPGGRIVTITRVELTDH